ncbi:MAG: SAF domain-containing protein, partial [Actinobacteria bacterium]|nr:SAF domain-containing protein [Actinomycetota bacterium]
LKGHFIRRRIKSGTVFSIIGILLMLAMIAMIYFWETSGREKYLYKEVVVLNQNVEENTQVTPEMLDLAKINPVNFIEGAVVKKEEVVGKYSVQFLAKNSQISLSYFKDSAEEVIKEDFYIFSIPTDWIITFPNSLRRGDIIYFYPVKIEVKKEEQGKTIDNIDNLKITDKSSLFESEVAYLKDSGNREVVDTEDSGQKPRYDASANISSIEIITNYEDVSRLQGLADSGFKFIILYKAGKN